MRVHLLSIGDELLIGQTVNTNAAWMGQKLTDEGWRVTSVVTLSDEPEAIPFTDFTAIDADSSPIRYRACFATDLSLPLLTETYVTLEEVTPRNGPGWFECFDAEAIAEEMAAGRAVPFLGAKNIAYGVDRIVVITESGRGYVWHELNDCGEKAYDGTVIGEECPPPPAVGGN